MVRGHPAVGGHRGLVPRHAVGQRHEQLLLHRDERRESAVALGAGSLRRGTHDHPVADPTIGHALADLTDDARDLVPHRARLAFGRVQQVADDAVDVSHVGVAHPRGLHVEHHLAGTGDGLGNLVQRDGLAIADVLPCLHVPVLSLSCR